MVRRTARLHPRQRRLPLPPPARCPLSASPALILRGRPTASLIRLIRVLLGRALGLDGSKLSWQAFDFAAGLIQRRNAGGRMCVMHVAATGEKAELVPESLK